jgi:Ca2+-binding RTX toxin-like protein
MMQKYILRITIAILGALVIFSAVNAMTASNSVPTSHIKEQKTALTTNNKKPAQCTMNITAVVVCTGAPICSGANGNVNELILGTSNSETIKGNGGSDCILGGDGDDDIQGNNGGDVCFGGLGNDTFNKCETKIDP